MDLKRYSLGIQYYGHWPEIDEEHDQERGDWVRWADVLAWRDSIRAAVDAERAIMRETNGCVLPGAALDALLADGGE